MIDTYLSLEAESTLRRSIKTHEQRAAEIFRHGGLKEILIIASGDKHSQLSPRDCTFLNADKERNRVCQLRYVPFAGDITFSTY